MRTLNEMFRDMQEWGLEDVVRRFYSFYAGIVDSADDPSQIGRACVEVPVMNDTEPYPDLAVPASPYAGPNYGFYSPPHKGDQVHVWFDHGDPQTPHYMGGFWSNQNEGDDITQSEVPYEFVNAEGVEAKVRGFKTRGGSLWAFSDDNSDYSFEVYTAKSETETDPDTGLTRPKLGQPSKKEYRVLLDSTNQEIRITTLGEGDSEEDEFEARRHHEIQMRDTETDRFVRIKTIGKSASEFHQLLMQETDSEKKIRLSSSEGHFLETDDIAAKSTWSTKDGFLWLIDQGSKLIRGATPAGRTIEFNDQSNFSEIATPVSQKLRFETGKTTLEDALGDVEINAIAQSIKATAGVNVELTAGTNVQVTAGGALSAQAASADLTTSGAITISGGSLVANIAAAASLIASGSITIQGATISVTAADITLGPGAAQRLMNETALSFINSHFHISGSPGSPTLSAAASGFVLVPGTHSTIITKAG